MALLISQSSPADSVGSNGDYALVTSARFFIGPKANGTWTGAPTYALQGPSGPPLLSGTGAPASTTGAVGQLYLNASTLDLIGPKVANGWPSTPVSNLRGAVGNTGPAGNYITFGTAEPGLTYGNSVGDLYVKTTTLDLYSKITFAGTATTSSYPNGWQIIGNLKGSVGADGKVGAAGATIRSGTGTPSSSNPSTQNDGDYFFATDTKTLYGPRASGSWPSTGTVLQGNAGTSGSNGLSIVSNTAAPTSSDGVVGSPAFINTAAGTLYGAKTSSGWPSSFINLVGASGTNGTNGVQQPGLYYGSSAPTTSSPSGAVIGSYYINTASNQLYGPLASGGWPSTGVSLVGPAGASSTATLPNDITGNSVAIAPVSGDSSAVQFNLANSSGVSLFKVDASGNVTAGGTLKVTGASTLGSTSVGALTASSISDTGTLSVSGSSTLAALAATNVSASGTLSAAGNTTLAAVSAGAITCTSVTNSGSTSISGTLNASAVAVTLPSSGAATYPILLKSSGGTSLLSTDTSGNIIASNVSGANISASGTLTATGATTLGATTTGALSATNVTASGTLAVSGATTAAAITSSATVTGKNVTLTSGGGGVLTFADGSTQSSAAATASTPVTRAKTTGYYWGSASANTAVSMYMPLVGTTSSYTYGAIPVAEAMPVAGTLHSVSAYCPGAVTASTVSITVQKNGTNVFTASNVLTCNSSSSYSKGSALVSTSIPFAANDVLFLTATFSAAGNACVYASVFYNFSS